jgi:hypothetical protein
VVCTCVSDEVMEQMEVSSARSVLSILLGSSQMRSATQILKIATNFRLQYCACSVEGIDGARGVTLGRKNLASLATSFRARKQFHC